MKKRYFIALTIDKTKHYGSDSGIVAAGRVVASSVKAPVIITSGQSIGKDLDHLTPYR